ncbi:MAG TPA: alpha-2-macroglobulin family protein, partial [Puia sp.]|nr:alpha-2-macroglobulin family protein [Puia sp.]
KNVGHLYARIIRIDDATRDALGNNGWNEEFWKRLLRFPVLKSFDQRLPETNDYQQHRVEIKVDALPLGQYALFTSSDPAFSENAALAVQFFFCSSIAFINHGDDYFVADRNTGEPLAEVKVQTLYQQYDSRLQKPVYHKERLYSTDLHGHFRLIEDKAKRYYERRLEFYRGKDYLSVSGQRVYSLNNDDVHANMSAKAYEKEMLKDILFTDRSIYRPGQTVYFKGLMVTRDSHTKKYKIAGGIRVKLYLVDVNDQPVDSLTAEPNDFGSFHGSFELPDHSLTGLFEIRDSLTEDSREFSVEEYKRPKFYVEYNPVKGSYRIGDSIHITGAARGYAGNNISGSAVRYRVFRESRFPYPWFFRRPPQSAGQEIMHGESVTDSSGRFYIDFPATADPAIRKESKPVFSYRIETDVTDLNGETGSATTSVSASFQSFQIVSSLAAESRMEADSFYRIPVTTRNSSGEFQPQLLTVEIYRLKPPDRLIRKRYWEQPDQFVMSKADYIKFFPSDEYRDETNKASWERISTLLKKTDSTRPEGFFSLGTEKSSKFSAGWYLMEFSAKDESGETITDRRYIELTGNREKNLHYPVYNAVESDEQTGEPGKLLSFETGTSATGVFVFRTREGLADSLPAYSYYRLNNEIRTTTLTVEEKDRGGFAVSDAFIKNNRWYNSNHRIYVPWTNKELQISYETWREKMLPGSAEKWKVKISGNKGDKVAAEVLTAMYDASLDQFKKHSWASPDLYPLFTPESSWSGSADFDDQTAIVKAVKDGSEEHYYKSYDRLISPGGGNNRLGANAMFLEAEPGAADRILIRGVSTLKKSASPMQEAKFAPPKVDMDENLNEEIAPGTETQQLNPAGIQIRKNFNETAFFFPGLKTDADGNVEISFTMPEALTQWKWMIFAHTRDLAFGYSEKTLVTQKELMLQPDMPRFFREGDTMQLPVKISNLSSASMTGTVQLDWLDASGTNNQNIAFRNKMPGQPFHMGAGQSTVVYFPAIIPNDFQQPVMYRLQAKANAATDGEENILPVLSNRMLLTETLPLNTGLRETVQFSWKKLLESGSARTLKHQSLTVE